MAARPAFPAPRKTVLAWSGGKDCALALLRLREDPSWQVTGLLTTFTEAEDAPARVQMHELREPLLRAQAAALGLPLHPVRLPPRPSNAVYGAAMSTALATLRAAGTGALAFGDLHLADLRAWREEKMAASGIEPHFPLWGEPPAALSAEIVRRGIRARLVCVHLAQLPATLLGAAYDAALLSSLPAGVDPCGEHGEFHTFVHDGPGFAAPVAHRPGAISRQDGHAWLDLLPSG